MNVSDWITLAAVLVALGIGVSSIIHTERIQKKQYRHTRLKEIVEWVLDVREWNTNENLMALEGLSDRRWQDSTALASAAALVSRLIKLEEKGEYISQIILDFDEKLQNEVEELKESIRTHVGFAALGGPSWDGLRGNKESLNKCVSQVLAEVIKALGNG